MNGAIFTAALVMINPQMQGDWCYDNNGVDTMAVRISSNEITVYEGRGPGSVCRVDRKAPSIAMLNDSGESMIYVTPRTLQTNYLDCAEEDSKEQPSRLYVGLKLTIAPDGLQQWYIDKTFASKPQRKLFACAVDEEY